MIVGHGIDIIEIDRFKEWHNFNHASLRKIFSEEEIIYSLGEPNKTAERFAVRFAAKEALYKALCQAIPTFSMPFFVFCKKVWVDSSHKVPEFIVELKIPINWALKLSLSHSKLHAIASVIVQEKNR